MKDAVEAVPAERPMEQEGFANRKLIRPSLTRNDHNHSNHNHSSQNNHAASAGERRERPERQERPDRGDRGGSMGGKERAAGTNQRRELLLPETNADQDSHGCGAARRRRNPRRHRVVRQGLHQAEPGIGAQSDDL